MKLRPNLRGRVSRLSFEFETSGCKKIAETNDDILKATSLELFIIANFSRKTPTSGWKKIAAALQFGRVAIFLQPLISNSTEKLPQTEAN